MKKILVFILLFFVLSQVSCGKKEIHKRNALLMGTFVEIQIFPEKRATKSYLDNVIESAFSEIRKAEKVFSLHNPDSELSNINKFGTDQPYQVSREFMYLLRKAKIFSELTKGAFDVSVAPMEEIWHKASISDRIPSQTEIGNILDSIGVDKVVIDEEKNVVQLQSGMRLDFGAIAKGYAVDRAIVSLKRDGIKNAIVNAGGDIYCLGGGVSGLGWQIGIRDPVRKSDCIATLLLKNRAIATSGGYERFYTIENKRFSHIINPTTGNPIGEVQASVTVLAEDCLTADAIATAIFVLGPAEGMKLLNQLEDVEGVIISRDSGSLKIEKTKGLKEIHIFDEE